jgi:methylenetetrahydrofolate dehydrogenase (NADP+) / methenyltetrahydrofolate cyclohydrolase
LCVAVSFVWLRYDVTTATTIYIISARLFFAVLAVSSILYRLIGASSSPWTGRNRVALAYPIWRHSRTFPASRTFPETTAATFLSLNLERSIRRSRNVLPHYRHQQQQPFSTLYSASSMSTTDDVSSSDPPNLVDHRIIDGKQIALDIRHEIQTAVAARVQEGLPPPGLAVVLVGSRRDSQTYVSMKKKACAAAGIVSIGYDFDETVTELELLQCIDSLNTDDSIHGILIQLPLPSHLDQDLILRAVNPAKDVDGLHPVNTAALQLYRGGGSGSVTSDIMNAPFSIPCTPLGCLVLLDRSGINVSGKHCVVLGRSQLVGLPMARLLLGRDATVTVCHSKTVNIAQLTAQADVLVAAVGRAQLVKSHWLKDGAVVIDVGINSVDVVPSTPTGKTYKLVGDVDYDDCYAKCRKITPVPGGVGPMTIAMLLQNTLRSCERLTQNSETATTLS